MNTSKGPIPYLDQLTFDRLINGIRRFAASDVGPKAKWMFAALMLLMLSLNGMNVVNSYVGRDFMTAIENKNMHGFIGWALVFIGILALTTLAAVMFRFTEERLGLLWREWMTQRFLGRYLNYRVYYQMTSNDEVENPDQRMTDDIKAYTTGTLSFLLMFLNSSFTVVAFSGVLWSISPLLFMVAVLYAGGGSLLAIKLGRPMIGLNYDQLDREANFRACLIRVRENAEPIALLHREAHMHKDLLGHLHRLVENMKKIIEVNRNLGFFTSGYNYLIQIIPALIVAPLFINGTVEFGVIIQAAMAFTQLVGAFSLVVTNFQSLSNFTAVITRLGALDIAITYSKRETPDYAAVDHDSAVSKNAIIVCEDQDKLIYEHLTLTSGQDGHILLKDLTKDIPLGTRTRIVCAEGLTAHALFRATAGIWEHGAGHIVRPDLNKTFFLPEHPYLPRGTLRALLDDRTSTGEIPLDDEKILGVLKKLGLDDVVSRSGGLDGTCKWDCIMSEGEQELMTFARLILEHPSFALIENPESDLRKDEIPRLLDLLSEYGITYIVIGQDLHDSKEDNTPNKYYDAVLKIDAQGGWTWSTAK